MVRKYPLSVTRVDPATYTRVVDNSFQQFLPPAPPIEDTINVESFFYLYNQIFYDIPTEGSINSHEFLVKKSGEYINMAPANQDIQLLLTEINDLRKELLETNQKLFNLQLSSSVLTPTSSFPISI
jgi:hypothetical protein